MNEKVEIMQTAFNALVWARGAQDPMAEVRAESVLFDACLSAGMDFDEPNHIEWAAVAINNSMGSL